MDDVATAATYRNTDSDTDKCGEPVDRHTKEDSDGTGIGNATFALQLSRGIVHLSRAASRSRWGHSLVKVRPAIAVGQKGPLHSKKSSIAPAVGRRALAGSNILQILLPLPPPEAFQPLQQIVNELNTLQDYAFFEPCGPMRLC